MDYKAHLYHSHVTGKYMVMLTIFGTGKLEKTIFFPCFVHNLLGFDFFFFVEGGRLCVWRTKNFSIRGNNLTNVNCVNIANQVKFMDYIKYYQQSLLDLFPTMTPEQKTIIKELSKKFL